MTRSAAHTEAENIESALASLIGTDPLVPQLSRVLDKCRRAGGVRFREIEAIAGAEARELILLAWEFRLLIPRQTGRCAEWDDRVMRFAAEEIYDTVHVVDYLLSSAAGSGAWNLDAACGDLYADMGDPESPKMPRLIRRVAELSENRRISAAKIHLCAREAGITNQTGAVIAILKGGGVISPKLLSVSPAEKSGNPIYEVHPVLIAEVHKEMPA
jgi:hypothetical protein